MRTLTILGLSLAIFCGLNKCLASPIQVPIYKQGGSNVGSDSPSNGIFTANLAQEVDLPVALFQETNASFDAKIYESVQKTVKGPAVVSFLLVTFVFSSPSTNDPVYAFSEMGTPDELVWNGKKVLRRRGSTNQIPLIRVSTVDRHGKDLTGDLDLLIGVAPLSDSSAIQYVRRSFHFIWRDGWKGDLAPARSTNKGTISTAEVRR